MADEPEPLPLSFVDWGDLLTLDATNGRESLLAMHWKFYFDESLPGDGVSGRFVSAGIAATRSEWSRFVTKWERVLDKHPSIPHFHQADIGIRKYGKGVFFKCGLDDAQIARKRDALVDVLARFTTRRYVVTFDLKDFEFVTSRFGGVPDRYKNPYLFGFYGCLRLAASFMDGLPGKHRRPAVIFEQWKSEAEQALARTMHRFLLDFAEKYPDDLRIYKRWLQRDVLFLDGKGGERGLEAADIVAGYYRHVMQKTDDGIPWAQSPILGDEVLGINDWDTVMMWKWMSALKDLAAWSQSSSGR